MQIRPYTPADADDVRALNAANVPEVGPLDEERLSFFAAEAWFRVAQVEDRVAGFLVGLLHGTRYWSPNYRWFAERHGRFAYVDRVAVRDGARRLGIGSALYAEFEQWARATHLPTLCAEVNHEPPNPGSAAFHRARGFARAALFDPYGDGHVVEMVIKRLDPAASSGEFSGSS